MGLVYDMVLQFKKKYPSTITWFRLKQHSKVIEGHINPGEKVLYVFAGQYNENVLDFFQTSVIAITNERILIGQKRVTPGYFLSLITPDLFNDLKVSSGFIWGTVIIDTVKEVVTLTNISKSALDEIETKISTFMIRKKKEYGRPMHKK